MREETTDSTERKMEKMRKGSSGVTSNVRIGECQDVFDCSSKMISIYLSYDQKEIRMNINA